MSLVTRGRKANAKVASAALAAASLVATAAAGDQLLIDPSFENNPLIGSFEVLNYFEQYQGNWGVENAVIAGTTGKVVPPDGKKMLQMWDAGGIVTQVFHVTDVTAYSSLIDSGKAVGLLSALFNVENAPLARTVVHLTFYSGPAVRFEIGTFWSLLDLDEDVNTWEMDEAQVAVPVGTRWTVADIAYDNQLLQGNPGYVDSASLRIVPEPTSLVGLGAGFGLVAWQRLSRARRRAP